MITVEEHVYIIGCKNPQWGHCTNGPGKQSSHLTGPPCSV